MRSAGRRRNLDKKRLCTPELQLVHPGLHKPGDVLSYQHNADIAGAEGFVKSCIDLSRRFGCPPADSRQRKTKDGLRVANDDNLHRGLAIENQERDDEAVDGDALRQADEDQRTTEGLWFFGDGAHGRRA